MVNRRWWAAGLLSFLVPGLGQAYNGQVGASLSFYGLFLVSWVASTILFLYIPGAIANIAVPFAVILLVWGVGVAHAVWTARKRKTLLRPFNRWYVYGVAVLVHGFLIQPPLSGGLKRFVAEGYRVPTSAMAPTLQQGDHILVAKGQVAPRRGSLLVFKGPHKPDTHFVSRVVGLPGDTLQMRDKALLVNGAVIPEAYVRHFDSFNLDLSSVMGWQREFLAPGVDTAAYRPTRDDWGPIIVPERYFFALGDNRDDSEDSRYYGFVPESDIIGKPIRIYFSLDPQTREIRWERLGQPLL